MAVVATAQRSTVVPVTGRVGAAQRLPISREEKHIQVDTWLYMARRVYRVPLQIRTPVATTRTQPVHMHRMADVAAPVAVVTDVVATVCAEAMRSAPWAEMERVG